MTLPLVTILDDEPAIRSILADALQEAGFRTMGFARATEFEAALKSTTPDVCLVDLGLPDRDGLGLVHRLAALAVALPRLLLSLGPAALTRAAARCLRGSSCTAAASARLERHVKLLFEGRRALLRRQRACRVLPLVVAHRRRVRWLSHSSYNRSVLYTERKTNSATIR